MLEVFGLQWMFCMLTLLCRFVRLEAMVSNFPMDIVNEIYSGLLRLRVMYLHGVDLVVVIWSSSLAICEYPLAWWLCSFTLWSCEVNGFSCWVVDYGALVTWKNIYFLDYNMECLCWIHGFSPWLHESIG